MVQLDLDISQNMFMADIRSFVLDNLKGQGEPLRWAITDWIRSKNNNSYQIKIEAIMIIEDS